MYLASPAYSELANPFEQTEGWDLILRLVREVTLAARALESSTVPPNVVREKTKGTKQPPELLVLIALNEQHAAAPGYEAHLIESIVRISCDRQLARAASMTVSLYGAHGGVRHKFERRANPRSCFSGRSTCGLH